ncbi:MAG: ADP-ribosyltransferase, partial [Anaerovoracaceae bacterium]
EGLLKNKLDHDIIVYRNERNIDNLISNNNKFLSTSVTQKGVIGGKPNVAIIVPKGTNGAYVEKISDFKEQREFLINTNFKLEEVADREDIRIFKVVNENDELE